MTNVTNSKKCLKIYHAPENHPPDTEVTQPIYWRLKLLFTLNYLQLIWYLIRILWIYLI